jgi:hypothetical protein
MFLSVFFYKNTINGGGTVALLLMKLLTFTCTVYHLVDISHLLRLAMQILFFYVTDNIIHVKHAKHMFKPSV